MNKKNILTYSLGLFVIVIALSIAVWSFVFTELTTPKDYQTLNVFITANSGERSYIKDNLQSIDGVKKSDVILTAEKDEYYGAQLSSVGLFNCDLLILNVNDLPEKNLSDQFAPLEKDFLKTYGLDVDNLTFVFKEDNNYAVIVFDKKNNVDLLKGIVNFDETQVYCAVINAERPNAAPYSKGDNVTDNAFKGLVNLLSLNKNA